MKKISVFLGLALVGACGGGGSNGTGTATPTTSASTAASASAATSASAAPSASVADNYDDPNESSAPIVLTPLFDKKIDKKTFPKASIAEGDCYKTAELHGEHVQDFEALIAKCGKPAGLLEYAKPANGRLHHIKDKRDTFSLKVLGGFCYRYFAAADGTIKDIDILVDRNGSIIAEDKQTQPVAIIDFSKSWCVDDDGTYSFHVEVDGVGQGGYTFGVWARPK